MLKIITYNIETGKNIDKIFNWIEEGNANTDIICFQEYPKDNIKNLSKNEFISKYSHSFSPGLKKNGQQLGQLTLYNKKEFKLIEEYTIDIGHDDLEVLYKKTPTRRSALITTFEKKGDQFIIANVHLSAFAFNLRRRKQTEKVLEGLIKAVPIILLGDFNYSNLIGRKYFIKFMENLDLEMAGEEMITNKYKGLIRQQLDYVFYKGFKFSDIKVEILPFSDHYPVIVNFETKK